MWKYIGHTLDSRGESFENVINQGRGYDQTPHQCHVVAMVICWVPPLPVSLRWFYDYPLGAKVDASTVSNVCKYAMYLAVWSDAIRGTKKGWFGIFIWYDPTITQTPFAAKHIMSSHQYDRHQPYLSCLHAHPPTSSSMNSFCFPQNNLRAKYVTCVMHTEKGDVVTGDSNGTVYVWGYGCNLVTNLIKHAHDVSVHSH